VDTEFFLTSPVGGKPAEYQER